MITNIKFNEVIINDGFWTPKLNQWKKDLVRVCLDKCYESGRIDNFKKAGGLMNGDFEGIYFNDSDVYKVLEGAAYILQLEKDPVLEAEIDTIITYIEAAQEEDGYLDTYYTLVEPENKWTDMEKHEMYCGGHLIEAAVAYYQATGKDKLLQVAIRLADYYGEVFGAEKRHWVEGHQEIELALIRLYHATGNKNYLELAKWLLEERGHGYGQGMIWDRPEWGPAYCQDDVPVSEITEAKGHSVRAMYMYAAMTDLVLMDEASEYKEALDRVWEDIIETKMYITGGIGSTSMNEGFEESYCLPNETAYCETCAAVGQILWNQRMNLLNKDAKHADIVEKALYNNVLSGISFDSKEFFYVNPLESKGGHHREAWFDTSCCPTNLVRLLPSIGNYISQYDEHTIFINQYIGSAFQVEGTEVVIDSEFPFSGKVKIEMKNLNKELKLRVPNWTKSFDLKMNGEAIEYSLANGYIEIGNLEQEFISFDLEFDMLLEEVRSHDNIFENRGKIAYQKGPFIYCVEEMDVEGEFDKIFAPEKYRYVETKESSLAGASSLTLSHENGKLVLVPYYTWGNRTLGKMKVWISKERTDSLYY